MHTVEERTEIYLKDLKFQRALDKRLQETEVTISDEDLKSKYNAYYKDLTSVVFVKYKHKSVYRRVLEGYSFEKFVAEINNIKENKSILSRRERDTLKVIYFLIKFNKQ